MTDFDSPWKEALDLYFKAFLLFFYSHIYHDIDWSRGFESLDKELQQIVPKAARGRRYVDKLVKVWRKDGSEVWVLLHVEVQTQRDRDFALRMFVYNYRIFDRYDRIVVSLAVLADGDPNWRPSRYEVELWGWSQRMTFLPVKLLEYANREAELEAESNPFARIVLAHLKALETRRDPEARRLWKFRLVRGLFERGFKAEDVRQLFRLIDWLMELPQPLEEIFLDEVEQLKEERRMPFIGTPERVGIRRGMLLVIESMLRDIFGEEGVQLLPEIKNLEDADKYLLMLEATLKANRPGRGSSRDWCCGRSAGKENHQAQTHLTDGKRVSEVGERSSRRLRPLADLHAEPLHTFRVRLQLLQLRHPRPRFVLLAAAE